MTIVLLRHSSGQNYVRGDGTTDGQREGGVRRVNSEMMLVRDQ